jgi:hypothetical protein
MNIEQRVEILEKELKSWQNVIQTSLEELYKQLANIHDGEQQPLAGQRDTIAVEKALDLFDTVPLLPLESSETLADPVFGHHSQPLLIVPLRQMLNPPDANHVSDIAAQNNNIEDDMLFDDFDEDEPIALMEQISHLLQSRKKIAIESLFMPKVETKGLMVGKQYDASPSKPFLQPPNKLARSNMEADYLGISLDKDLLAHEDNFHHFMELYRWVEETVLYIDHEKLTQILELYMQHGYITEHDGQLLLEIITLASGSYSGDASTQKIINALMELNGIIPCEVAISMDDLRQLVA